MGYFKKKTNELIPIKECLLMDKRINKLLPVLENISKNSDIKDIVIRISNDGSLLMLKLIGKIHDVKSLDNLVDILFINDEKIFGSDKMISNIGNKKYYVSIDSFFQVNKTLTEQLYNYVLNIVKEAKPKKLLDLYCGSGTIGIYVSDYADQIIGVELLRSSISDANENKKLNGVKNISFICNKVENVIDTFQNDVDLIIVDPPRAGLDKNTIVNIKRINPEKIIYISCDPVTMCRDIDFLSDKYDLVSVKPFNMFPRTYHVESVSILHRI